MIRKAFILSIMTCMLASLGVPLFASYDGDVLLGEEVVLRVRFPAGGLTVKERAEIIMVRLNEYLGSKPFDPADVRVAVRNKEYVVMIGNQVIITADQRTAEFNKATPEQLANMWASNLRRVIPQVKAE